MRSPGSRRRVRARSNNVGSRRRALSRAGTFLILVGLTGSVVGLVAAPASAVMEGPCVAMFNGIPFDDLDTPAKARERLVIQPGESVTAYGAAPDTDFIYIDVLFPPLAIPLISMESSEPGEQGSDISEVEVELPLGDFAKYGAGIFEFVARTDDCRGNAFFIIGGIAPWETAVGKTAVGVGVVGALIGLTSWIPAIVAGGGGIVRSVIAGGPVGVAIAVLVQQAGMIPLSGKSVGIAIVGSSVVAVVITKVLVGVHGAAAGASAGGALPTPPPGSPPAPTPPSEPTTVFKDPLLGGSEVPVPGAETAPPASTAGAGAPAAPSSAGGSPPPPSMPPSSTSGPAAGTGLPPSSGAGGSAPPSSVPAGGSAPPSSAPGAGAAPSSAPAGGSAPPSSVGGGGAPPPSSAPAGGGSPASSALGGASPAAGGPPISGLAAGAAAAVGATGVASRAAAARKRASAGGQLVDPYWFHVTEATDLYGLDEYESILGQLAPGAWYLAKATYDEWVHVWDEESGLEGWAAKHATIRQGG